MWKEKALLINVKTGEDVAFRVTHRLARNCAICSKAKNGFHHESRSQNLLQDVFQDRPTNEKLKRKLFEDVILSTSGLKKCLIGT